MLSKKDPSEIIVVTFDFTLLAAAVLTPAVTVAVLSGGTDPNPSAMLSGVAQISGSKVLQKIIGGVDGVIYNLRCQVDVADGSRFVLSDALPVLT